MLMYIVGFNPRARVGRDFLPPPILVDKCSFNPRARVGRDRLTRLTQQTLIHVSIHAPAWGATPKHRYR